MAFNTSPNPHHLYRDTNNGVILGVCAGLAAYMGWERRTLRIITVIAMIFFLPQVLAIYGLAAILVKPKPARIYGNDEEATFWREVSTRPTETFSSLRYRFRVLEERLERLEKHTTSREFMLNRDFQDLDQR